MSAPRRARSRCSICSRRRSRARPLTRCPRRCRDWAWARRLLASAAGKKLRLWDSAGQLKRELPAHPSTIADLQWKPGEPLLVSIAYGQLAGWSPEKPEPVRRYEWSGSMLAVAWSPDGKFLATGDQDATVHFWILKTGKDLQMAGYQTKVRELSWDQRSRYLATGGGPNM